MSGIKPYFFACHQKTFSSSIRDVGNQIIDYIAHKHILFKSIGWDVKFSKGGNYCVLSKQRRRGVL